MNVTRLKVRITVESVDPALKAAFDWIDEDSESRECSAVAKAFLAGARWREQQEQEAQDE